MRRRTLLLLVLGAASFGGPALSSCAPKGFQDSALVNTVRILATRADKPYAKPGDTVTLTVLAADGRTSRPEPMVVYWFPVSFAQPLSLPLPKSDFVCEDPEGDAYYACFASLASLLGGGDGGAPGDGGAKRDAGSMGGIGIGPGVDLSAFLPTGPTLSVPIPGDIITKHAPVSGTMPYGVALVFNMACAGHPEILPPDPTNLSKNLVPIGCFDKSHNQVGPDGYVVGYATVYAYDKITNANPVIDQVIYQGKDLDGGFLGDSSTASPSAGDGGIAVPLCATPDAGTCPPYTFDIDVPQSSWEVDPQDKGANGQPLHEQIWVDYYWTAGSFSDDSRLIYDPSMGKVGGTAVTLTAPTAPTKATFWAVVHDNRGGVSWDIVPYEVK